MNQIQHIISKELRDEFIILRNQIGHLNLHKIVCFYVLFLSLKTKSLHKTMAIPISEISNGKNVLKLDAYKVGEKIIIILAPKPPRYQIDK